MVSGGLPLVAAQIIGFEVDPFDHPLSYVVWLGGSFFAGMRLAYVVPERKWQRAFAVLSGFLGAMILEILIDSYTGRASHNLWPLSLVFSIFVAAPPVFIGAYFGGKLKNRGIGSPPQTGAG